MLVAGAMCVFRGLLASGQQQSGRSGRSLLSCPVLLMPRLVLWRADINCSKQGVPRHPCSCNAVTMHHDTAYTQMPQ